MATKSLRVAVLVSDGFEDVELVQPVEFLKEQGVEVTLIGTRERDRQAIKGKRRTVVEPHGFIHPS